MPTILIIEDEQDLAELVAYNLQSEGFRTLIAGDGATGVEMARRHLPALILLDLMLPGIMGTDVCKILKKDESTATIPIMMLTARGEEIDRVVGFEVGADDYLVKPFSTRELLLRIKAVLRRTTEKPVRTITLPPLVIDCDRHTVTVAGNPLDLTVTEFKLLLYLAERRDRLQSREILLANVWGYTYGGDTRTVDTHITRLRTKLGPAGEMIKTIRGFGYKLEAEGEAGGPG